MTLAGHALVGVMMLVALVNFALYTYQPYGLLAVLLFSGGMYVSAWRAERRLTEPDEIAAYGRRSLTVAALFSVIICGWAVTS